MADLEKEQLHSLVDAISFMLGEDNDFKLMLARTLNADDDQFEILAPGLMEAFQRSVNNPNDKILLTQSMNANGFKAEDVSTAFMELADDFDALGISTAKKDFLKEMIMVLANAVNDTDGIAKRYVPIAIELCHPDAKIPQYAHISDSGADVYALEDITVHPGETVLVPTGLKVALLPGFEFQVRPKSGRALKTKLRVANTPGTIDQGYRDEIKIIIENVEPPIKDISVDEDGKVTSILYGKDFFIGKGEKFCQLVLCEVPKASFYRVDSVLEIDKDDRNGGFGSTGLT